MIAEILQFDAIHLDMLQAILKPKDSLITQSQAAELLSAPSGSRLRIYGLMFEDDRYQIVTVGNVSRFDSLPIVAQWLSGTNYADLITRA